MKIINFGSLNIDRVYQVEHFVKPGETITSIDYREFAGGKGLNQSIALARAGVSVFHAGKVGADGRFLVKYLEENGVDVSLVHDGSGRTGHAINQVDAVGENAIVLYAGENKTLTPVEVATVISEARTGDYLLLQNEINRIEEIISLAAEKKLNIALNPAPMTPEITSLALDQVKWLIVNEIEGSAISGKSEPSWIIEKILHRYPDLSLVLTMGSKGVHYADSQNSYFVPAEKVAAVDTTAAGDTFIGYFIAEIVRGMSTKEALISANKAAALCVTKAGAAESIPYLTELV